MIWDCFIFNCELDILEIRLNVLDSIVDKFVLVECEKTHTNLDKPLYFEENKERFKQFEDKIIHIIIKKEELPQYKSSWSYENFQRNSIAKVIEQADNNDIIILSDVDEIPNPKVIMACKDMEGIKSLKMDIFVYFLNNLALDRTCCDLQMTKVFSPKDMGSLTLSEIKFDKSIKQTEIKNGGWHFSNCGGEECARIKYLSCSYHENEDKNSREDLIKSYKKDIKRRRLWEVREFLFGIKINNYFPKYLVENKEKYTHLFKKEQFWDINFLKFCAVLCRKFKNFFKNHVFKRNHAKI